MVLIGRQLIPKENMYLQNIHDQTVYANSIYIPLSLSEEDFKEITKEEYDKIIAIESGDDVTREEYNKIIERLEQVEETSQDNAIQITDAQIALCEIYEQTI